MTRIGFIGQQHGGPMAANLARAGHTVQVFDLVAESLTRASRPAASPPAMPARR